MSIKNPQVFIEDDEPDKIYYHEYLELKEKYDEAIVFINTLHSCISEEQKYLLHEEFEEFSQ